MLCGLPAQAGTTQLQVALEEPEQPVTVYTGTCGENATYSLDITTGQLTISGTGTLTAAPQLDSSL